MSKSIPPDRLFSLSLGGANLGVIIKEKEVSWQLIKDTFQARPQVGAKNAGFYVFGRFNNDHRSKEDLISRSALVIDMEAQAENVDVTACLNELKRRIIGNKAIVHTTFQHDPVIGKMRYRVIIPLANDISGEEYEAATRQLVAGLEDAVDDACTRCAQCSYLPALYTEESVWDCEVIEGEGFYAPGVSGKYSSIDDERPRIQDGERNTYMSAYALRVLKRYGNEDNRAEEAFLYEAGRCEPPLSKNELDNIWSSAHKGYHRKVLSDPNYLSPVEFEKTLGNEWMVPGDNGKKRMDYTALASSVIADVPLFYNGVEFMRYNSDQGIYLPDGDAFVRQLLQREYLREQTTNSKINDAISAIKRELYTAEPFDTNDPSKIVLLNGIFDLHANTFVEGFDPNMRSRTRHDFPYDPSAICPATDELITTIFGIDSLPFIYEWFGFCLYRAYTIKAMLMLLGEKDTGKSTFINLLQDFVGEGSYSNISLHALTNKNDRFSVINLMGKTLNADADAQSEHIGDGAMLKKLSGWDDIDAEPKGQPHVKFKNYAKLVFGMNELPTATVSNALAGRIKILETQAATMPDKQFLELVERAKDERSGIFNKAVLGLQRLLKNHEFTETSAMRAAVDAWQLNNDTVALFVKEVIERTQGEHIEMSRMYPMYQTWCRQSGRAATSKQKFNERLRKMGFSTFKSGVDKWRDVRVVYDPLSTLSGSW